MKHITVCALLLALLTPVVSYAADSAEDVVAVNVRYGDLDLGKSADAAVMLRRIDAAASQACGASDFSLKEYRLAVGRSSCHQESMSRAVAALNARAVSALYDAGSDSSRTGD